MNRAENPNSHEKSTACPANSCLCQGSRGWWRKGRLWRVLKRCWWPLSTLFFCHPKTAYWLESHYLSPEIISLMKLALLTAEALWAFTGRSYLEGQMLTCGHISDYFLSLTLKLFKVLAPKTKKGTLDLQRSLLIQFCDSIWSSAWSFFTFENLMVWSFRRKSMLKKNLGATWMLS